VHLRAVDGLKRNCSGAIGPFSSMLEKVSTER